MKLGTMQKNVKYILLVVLSLAIFGTTVFFGKNAADFFAKASSCPVKNVRAEKVAANTGTIVWDTDDDSQGRVEYGTNPQSLTFTAPEATAAKNHNVPLTLLTPNTIYYYMITIGDTKCDSTGQKCEAGACVPYSFTTVPLGGVTTGETEPTEVTEPIGAGEATPTTSQTKDANPTSTLSLFCRAVQANIGTSTDAQNWSTIKTYDVDSNGIINGLDVIKCQKSGK